MQEGMHFTIFLWNIRNKAVAIWALGVLIFFSAMPLQNAWADEDAGCPQHAYEKERACMVEEQIRVRGVKSLPVLEAMKKIPRHCFVPKGFRDEAYDDHPLPIGMGQTISQPYIVALMTELLDLKPTDRVLEIGTGSGYHSAVVSMLVKELYSMEIYQGLGDPARTRLMELGYNNVKVRIGDGFYGWKEHAPYDAILVTAAASEIPPPLVQQLDKGGKMCIPVGGIYLVQNLMLVTKDINGSISTRSVLPVAFVPLLGGHGN